MAWADTAINESVLKGLAGSLMTDPVIARYQTNWVTESRVAAAKSLVEDLLLDPKAGDLVDLSRGYDTLALFMDAIADATYLATSLDRALVYAFIYVFAWDSRNQTDDNFYTTANAFMSRLKSAIRVLAVQARAELTSEEPGDATIGSEARTLDLDM